MLGEIISDDEDNEDEDDDDDDEDTFMQKQREKLEAEKEAILNNKNLIAEVFIVCCVLFSVILTCCLNSMSGILFGLLKMILSVCIWYGFVYVSYGDNQYFELFCVVQEKDKILREVSEREERLQKERDAKDKLQKQIQVII